MLHTKMKSQILISVLLITLTLFCSGVRSYPKYTENELEAIGKLRHMMGDLLYRDYMKEDFFLIRWLKAKDMNVENAAKMLKDANKWRKDNRIDRILEETILNFPVYPFYNDGLDNTGNPIAIFVAGRIDSRKIVLSGKSSDLVRFWDQFLEFGEVGIRSLAMNNTALNITGGTSLLDLNGYNLRTHACIGCFAVYFDWLRHYEAYYPGLLKDLLFINTPRVFAPLLELLKPLMSKDTRKVLKVYGPNKNDWVPYLLKYIEKDQLRYEYGGTMPE